MNGAEALLRTLLGGGVDVCFANPGTSEMHFVAALDTVPEMRGVLTLFEGVATGAADGYARMAGKPAATLLHLGPGLGNGVANLHNARRAGSPVVNVVGDHATFHKPLDAPLESDIDAVAGTVSGWVRRSASPAEVGPDAADAVAAAVGGGIQAAGQVATLILPADVSWTEDEGGAAAGVTPGTPLGRGAVDADALEAAAKALGSMTEGERCTILIGGDATREEGLLAASRIAAATGAQVLVETFPARHERGAGLPAFERLAYAVQGALRQLAGTRHLILAGAAAPVSFFGYPDTPSVLFPEGCEVHEVATHGGPGAAGLRALADLVAGDAEPVLAGPARPGLPSGELTAQSVAQVVGALLPERAIVVDESVTSGFALPAMTAGAPRHDVLTLTGGAIGYGLPAATGAAVACPDRPVWCLEADGSAMYTISALWTHAREQLDVTTIVFNNAAYAILRLELANVGATAPAAGSPARRLLDLGDPRLDFVSIATGMGVPAVRVTTAEELADALRRAAAEPGPHLVEALVPPLAP
ncbi:MAG: Benzoylformate decarboxylase [Pseudonocardia sp.]|jgi:acetolactate synthase-1/2/3 large subunit|uniref:acetolactate synthase large subunit n=1 Tax=Pseudonocardia sp. TaxID=60912 RepID=UPI00261BC609|nr:acetolactate synthase large subunit [Pseudonocardia sp.]MCU1625136.1 Benzoylformate decarboxylase [Pseudonocardia sp.]HEV7469390.1 acetolactate synthase large subunit [Pseudonocardia sp.]